MADVNANIGVNIDTSAALAQLKALQRQISQFHSSISRSSESAAIAQKSLQKNLIGSINSIGAFSAELRTVRTSAESFTNSLEKNKFSMREYFRYAGASTKTFGRIFKSEFDTIGKVAEERVKTLQTQYIKMGRNASGAMEAIAIRPTSLNMQDYGTRTAIAAQKQALFNQLMKQGTTNLLNFGKNTQWAGRQLMVGFTIPLTIVGSTATRTFMEMEAQALKFRKVYGDLFTPKEETKLVLDNITELGKQFTKYGVAVSTTVGLAAEAAAAGFQGLDLQRQTTEATRLSILGQVDSQKALETTISLQNAFGMSSDKLADSINFLNAVENQTVVSLDDITTAIPKVAPVIQQLGGDVKDLTFFIAAMKEGGINASEGANALKSGLAALINPTGKASEMLAKFGINANEIVEKNKGNLKATVVEFAEALNALDPLSRARSIEQMFGKFQFARLSTLFANVAKDGNQASRVLDLANASVEELSDLSEQELGMTADSAMNKFKKSVEDLKFALIPVGQAFLEAATPIVEFVGGALEKFGNLSDGTKKLITFLTVGIGAIGPIFLMTFGLIANAIANGLKFVMLLRQGYLRLTGQSQILAEQTQYLNTEQLEAAAAAHSLDQSHARLTQRFTAETAELQKLIAAYQSAARAGQSFMFNNPGMMMPGRATKKFAQGGMISGPGGPTSDSVPVMASNGEAIISAKTVKKYPGIIDGLISGNIPGFKRTGIVGDTAAFRLQDSYDLGHFAPPIQMSATELQAFAATQSQSVKDMVQKLIGSVTGGLEQVFDVFTNEVAVQGSKLNADLGKIGSKKTASKEMFRQESVAGAGAYNAPLLVKMKEAGASPEQLKIAITSLAKEFDEGIAKLGNQTTVTAEEVNKITQEAYDVVAKTNKQVKAAREEMKKPGVIKEQFGEVKTGGRTAFRGAYTTSANRKKVNDMVQANLPGKFPTQQGAKFASLAAQDVGIRGAQEIREIFRKLDNEAKKRVELLVGDVRAMSKQVIVEAEKAGIDIGKYAIKGISTGVKVASPSKETEKIGKDIARGLEIGMQSRQDDVALAGANLGKAATGGVKGGVGSIPFRAPGQPGSVAANAPKPGVSLGDITAKARFNRDALLAAASQKQTAKMTARMNSLNKGFMSGTFAISALSGIASTAGGNLGKFSEILFKISGPMFALSSILQLLTGQKIIGIIKNIGKLKFGVAAIALTGFVVATKLINDARKKELEYIYGLSNAMKTTTQQVKTLGDFFGIVPTKLPIDLKNREIVKKETRSERDKLRADEGFQAEFAPTIKTLSAATAEEARLAFTTLALNLKAQGFAEQQVQTIVDALREEAGKTSIKLDVKSLNFSAESIKGIQTQIAPIILSLEKGLKAGPTGAEGLFKGFKNSFLQAFQGKTPGALDTMSNAAKKSLSELSTTISSVSNSAAGMFKLGLISADDFESTMFGILGTTKNLNAENQKLVLMEIFKKLNVDAAPFLANLKGSVLQMQTLALLSSGVLDKESGVFKLLQSSDYEDQQRGRRELIKLYDSTIGAVSKVIKAEQDAADAAAAANAAAGKTNPLKERIKTIQNQTNAYRILRNAKIDEKTATELSNDAEIASLVIANSKGESLKKIIALINEYKSAIKAQADAELKYMEKPNLFKKQIERYQAQAELRDKIIDVQFASKIKAENDALKTQEQNLQKVNDQIQQITDSQIKPIQDIIDANNFALESISLQEDAINEKYNTQIEALDKIENINQNIANIQKQRLSIADALTRGDISAAAQLVQEARAENAASAITTQRDALTFNRDAQVKALGRVAIEKQNKQLQLDISKIERNSLLTLQQKKTTIETTTDSIKRNIDSLNLEVEVLKSSAYYAGLTKTEIDSIAELTAAAERAGIEFDAVLLSQSGNAQSLAKALSDALISQKALASLPKLVSDAGASTTSLANTTARGVVASSLGIPEQVSPKLLESIVSGAKPNDVGEATRLKLLAESKKTGSDPFGAGAAASGRYTAQAVAYYQNQINQAMAKATGGMVPKYYVSGGYSKGTDTIPAMLTPGEFVVRKNAVDSFGVNNLNKINDGSYGGSSVYNYSLNVNVKSDSSPDDIARTVMTQIKRIDSQRIKTQRGA